MTENFLDNPKQNQVDFEPKAENSQKIKIETLCTSLRMEGNNVPSAINIALRKLNQFEPEERRRIVTELNKDVGEFLDKIANIPPVNE